MMEDDIMKGMDSEACNILTIPLSGHIGILDTE
jgi:hypothetical protein